jgi:hypothetical protein
MYCWYLFLPVTVTANRKSRQHVEQHFLPRLLVLHEALPVYWIADLFVLEDLFFLTGIIPIIDRKNLNVRKPAYHHPHVLNAAWRLLVCCHYGFSQ